jgi:hypothetical protein
VLTATERKVRTIVARRHGAAAADMRCYFGKAKNPASGASRTDVDPAVRCGPVLFVDGTPARAYLSFAMTTTRTAANKAEVVTEDNPDPADPAAVPAATQLARPDGRQPPRTVSLAAPQPPAADARALVVSDLGSITPPKQLDGAEMISLDTGTRVIAAGVVARYGHGDDARSAPPGEQLIAFQLEDEPGESSDQPATAKLTLADASGSRPVPESSAASDYVVVAEPAGSSVNLVLKDGGYTQTLSLPGGRPGPANLTVLTRQNRFDDVTRKLDVPVTLSGGGNSVGDTFHTAVDGARLEFWLPNHTGTHPAHPGDAFLFVNVDYTDSNAPGDSFGYDPQLLSLRLHSGQIVHARNVAPQADRILDVFEVPGDFTTGTLLITGSEVQDGVTVRVEATTSIPISFSAG